MTRVLARFAYAGGLLGIGLLAVVHILRPELDPARHMVSEYAVGAHGWVMSGVFSSLGVGCASLLGSLVPHTRSLVGRIGIAFLAVAAVGLLMAAVFPTDPWGTVPEKASHAGQMHGLAVMIGNPGFILAALLLSFALRRNPAWGRVRLAMFVLVGVAWISFAAVGYLLVTAMQHGATVLPAGLGWANRALVVAYGGWLMFCAWPQARVSSRLRGGSDQFVVRL